MDGGKFFLFKLSKFTKNKIAESYKNLRENDGFG